MIRTPRRSNKHHRRCPCQRRPSVAVLPFSNLSGDPEQGYFADGMVDDIITGLSRIKWLFVIARNSSFTYRGRTIDMKQVGRELGVRYLLEGSVRKVSDRVRINAQLIDALTGVHVWAERYDRKFEDIFALQDEISLSAVGAIEPSLRQAEVERVKRKRPDSLDAYDLVLRAQPDIYSGMPDRSAKALSFLERALALDPDYALAHGFAAMGYHNRFLRAGLREEDRAASIRHAQAAIANGQDDALALTFAGFSIGMDAHDRAAAFTAFDAALAISPSSALAYILGSVIFSWTGEAERAIDWARTRDAPESVRSLGFCCLRLLRARAFPARPLCGCGSCRLQGRAIQSWPQHQLCVAGGNACENRTAGRSQSGRGTCFGIAPSVPVQPAIFRS